LAAVRNIEIVQKKINELVEAEYNPRQLSEKQHEDLKKSIETFGFIDPIIINVNPKRKNYVVGGHQRLKIAKMLNIAEVPCVELNLSKAQERELNIRLNKNSGTWDWDKLANEFDIDELVNWGFKENELFFDTVSKEFDLSDDKYVPENEKYGNAIIQYNIIFDNEQQQSNWHNFLQLLKEKYPHLETHSSRIDKHVSEMIDGEV
jgi:hypothetical protein